MRKTKNCSLIGSQDDMCAYMQPITFPGKPSDMNVPTPILDRNLTTNLPALVNIFILGFRYITKIRKQLFVRLFAYFDFESKFLLPDSLDKIPRNCKRSSSCGQRQLLLLLPLTINSSQELGNISHFWTVISHAICLSQWQTQNLRPRHRFCPQHYSQQVWPYSITFSPLIAVFVCVCLLYC